jgi:hypothetical protein
MADVRWVFSAPVVTQVTHVGVVKYVPGVFEVDVSALIDRACDVLLRPRDQLFVIAFLTLYYLRPLRRARPFHWTPSKIRRILF